MDKFKKKIANDMTAWDINCPHIYSYKSRGKDKAKMRRIARARLKREGEVEKNEN